MISVIIPVYNVEEFLPKGLNSIINQTYQNIEIILIDDGSSDNSGKICDEYSKKDNRIKVIHKKNGGVSSARNDGIKLAKGKFVYFMDPDDIVHTNILEEMIKSYNNTDIVICGYNVISNKSFNRSIEDIYIDNLPTSAIVFEKLYNKGLINPLWNKLFLKKYIGWFDKKLSMGEDIDFVLDYLKKIKRVTVNSNILYDYIKRPGSATMSFRKIKLDEIIDNNKLMKNFINSYFNNCDNLIKKVNMKSMHEIQRLFESPFNYLDNKNEIIHIYEEWLRNKKFIEFQKDLNIREKKYSNIKRVYNSYHAKYYLKKVIKKITRK